MTPACTIDAALADRKLLGAALGDLASWSVWRCVLSAAFANGLSEQQRQTFASVAGGRKPPDRPVRELIVIAGRRSGKSRTASAAAAFISTLVDHRAKLAAGEVGYVLLLSASRAQSAVCFRYLLAFLESSPILRPEISEITADEVRLRNGIILACHSNSFRTIRGRTLLACDADQHAFRCGKRGQNSAIGFNVGQRRAFVPPVSCLVKDASSPYRRAGLLFSKFRDCFGKDDDRVLCVKGATTTFNPTIDLSVIAQATADDPEAAKAEWDAEFRSDLAAFLDDKTIDAAIDYGRPLELPPRKGLTYYAHTDASGGRHDAFTLAVGHKEGERCICDVIRGVHPPFDPQAVVGEYAALLRDYKIDRITGDNYSAGWVETAWSDAGIKYGRSELTASALYLEALPIFTRGLVSIPDHARLVRELRLLERRSSRIGKDVVDHGPSGSDDYSNSLAGMLYALTGKTSSYISDLSWVGSPPADAPQPVSLFSHPALRPAAPRRGYYRRA
jgi:hypothetical protein